MVGKYSSCSWAVAAVLLLLPPQVVLAEADASHEADVLQKMLDAVEPGEQPVWGLPALPEEDVVVAEVARGVASWYGPGFHGRRTASGERFDMHDLTAAHRSLPFGTVVRVESLVNGRTVDVRINDRGPHIKQRVIDLSRGAAAALGLLDAGTGTKQVILKILAPERKPSRK